MSVMDLNQAELMQSSAESVSSVCELGVARSASTQCVAFF